MVSSAATTVSQYVSSLPADRRADVVRVRQLVNANLPKGYEEGMLFGMISWYVPLAKKPDTYNGKPLCLVSLAAQKNYCALYLMSVYGHVPLETKLRGAYAAAGKKLDMGKSCLRFKTADDLVPSAIADAIRAVSVDQYIARYDRLMGHAKSARTTAKPKPKAKSAPKAKPPKAAKAKAAAKPKKRAT